MKKLTFVLMGYMKGQENVRYGGDREGGGGELREGNKRKEGKKVGIMLNNYTGTSKRAVAKTE